MSLISKSLPPHLAEAIKVAAFDQGPFPALVIGPEGALAAVNEAAEALFGQRLSFLTRSRFDSALPPGSALVSLVDRALEHRDYALHLQPLQGGTKRRPEDETTNTQSAHNESSRTTRRTNTKIDPKLRPEPGRARGQKGVYSGRQR